MSNWQPIETAPRDGTKIILLIDGSAISGEWGNYVDCKGGEDGFGWGVVDLPSHGCGCCAGRNDAPTHWKPLDLPDDL